NAGKRVASLDPDFAALHPGRERELHLHARNIAEHREQSAADDGTDDSENDGEDDHRGDRREGPLDDDRDHAPERNLDVRDRNAMRRDRWLNGHRLPPRLCPPPWLAKVPRTAMGEIRCASSILLPSRARNGVTVCSPA